MLLVVLISLIMASVARAEYRVYRLVITDTATGEVRTVDSTLDDLQYPTYHALRVTEVLRLLDTWMCRGRRGSYQPLCDNPRELGTGSGPTQPTAQGQSPAPQAS